jgi:hypothetical protein|eukprot:1668190-Prymnesium_polylepis.1
MCSIKWEGYATCANTWEPAEHLNASMVAEFEQIEAEAKAPVAKGPAASVPSAGKAATGKAATGKAAAPQASKGTKRSRDAASLASDHPRRGALAR